jgi:hypothetical protein
MFKKTKARLIERFDNGDFDRPFIIAISTLITAATIRLAILPWVMAADDDDDMLLIPAELVDGMLGGKTAIIHTENHGDFRMNAIVIPED